MFYLNRTRKIPLLSLVLLSFSACTKSAKPTSIVGRVLTYGTDEVIDHPAVLVQLYRQDYAGCWGCGYNYEVIDEVWSDEEGVYQLQGNLYDDETYYLGVSESTVKESKGYLSPWDKDLDEYEIYSRGGVVQMDYHLVAFGWIRLNLSSTEVKPGDIYWYSVGGGVYEEFYGPVDVSRIWDFGGNFDHEINYGLYRDGEYISFEEKVFVPAFDTINFSLIFP
jgi:hypothetical protein